MRARSYLRTPVIAIATILSMLLVPACGLRCAAMNHCSTSASSANSDTCHHADMSAQSDSEALSLSLPVSCGQQAPLPAILTVPEAFAQLKFVAVAATPFSINIPGLAIKLISRPFAPLSAKESPQSIPLENPPVLRI